MEEKDLEKLFKVEKENESLSPPDFVWDNLENDLKVNKRKNRFVFWWFAGLLLVSISTFYLLQNRNVINENALPISETTKSKTSKTEFDSQSEKPSSQRDNENLTQDIYQDQTSNSSSSNTNENSQKDNLAQKQIAINSNTNQVKTSKSFISEINKTTSDNRVGVSTNTIIKSSPIDNDISSVLTPLFDKSNANSSLDDKTSNLSSTNTRQPRELVEIATVDNLSILLFVSDRNIYIPQPKPGTPIAKSTKKAKTLNSFFVYAHLGKPSFSNVTSSSSSPLIETDWYTAGLGLSYSRQLTNRLYFGGGLSFRQSKRKFNYESDELLLRDFESWTSAENNTFLYGKLLSQGEQRFSFVDVSTGIRYELFSGKIKISVGLAALFNFRLATEGKGIDSEGDVIRYQSQDGFYQSSAGFGLSPSISFGVPLRRNISLVFSPNYTTYFKNLESEVLAKEFGYSTFGLDAGLRYRF